MEYLRVRNDSEKGILNMKMNCMIGVVATLFVATPFLSHDKFVENFQSSLLDSGINKNLPHQEDPRYTTYEFETTLTFGEGKPESREYLLGFPWRLRIDSHNRFYLNDRQFRSIRVYDSEGSWITTIGRSGSGPGEFNEISDMTITRDDRLLVFDRMQMRITEYDVSGTTINTDAAVTYSSPESKVVTPIQMLAIPNEGYVVAYRHYSPPQAVQGGTDEMHDELLNFMSEDFSQITDYALPMHHLGDMENPYLDNLTGFPVSTLNMVSVGDNQIVVAPYFYEGTMFLVEKQSGEDWEFTQALEGFVGNPEAFTYYQNPNSSSIPSYAHSSGGGTAVVNNTSLGLFIEPNGTLVHITLQLEGADRRVFIEKFDSDLNLVSFGPVSNLDYQTRPEQYHVHFQAMDETGQVYFFDNRDRNSGMGITRGYIKESGTD